MSTTPTSLTVATPSSLDESSLDESSLDGPGQLLNELERRQDDVLAQLDDLDDKLKEVLKGLGVSEGSMAQDEEELE